MARRPGDAISLSVDGLKELDQALGELTKAVARSTLRRVLARAGEPIAEAARQFVPVDKGHLQSSIVVSTRINNPVGKAEYGAALRAGEGLQAAVKALRTARREAGGEGSFAEVYVGPTSRHKEAHLVEFGTAPHTIKARPGKFLAFKDDSGGDVAVRVIEHPGAAPHPYMRPAWDAKKGVALEIIQRDLKAEIAKAAARAARKKARQVAKGGR